MVRKRTLILGMAGPCMQVVGFIWEGLHLAIGHAGEGVTLRHLLFEPGVLFILVGLLVTLVCVPLALEVARSSPEDLEIPAFGVDEEATPARLEATD